jgi:hypothetical protein
VIHLDAPEPAKTRLVEEILEDVSAETKDDKTLKIAEPVDIGPVVSTQLSTIVTLAGGVANLDERELPAHGRSSPHGLRGFRSIVGAEAKSGLYILFGFDSHNSEDAHNLLSGAKIRFWVQGEPIPESSQHLLHLSGVAGLAEYAQPAAPGPHWVSVEVPEQKPIVSALMVLPQHLSMLIFDREADGEIRLFQYLPRLEPQVDVELGKLRQLELIQRFILQGRLGRAYDLINDSPRVRQTDPLAECMAGYVLLGLGKTEELGDTVDPIINSYPELSDGYVLKAEYEARRRNGDAAEAAYRTALDHGVPTFADGLVLLFGAVHEYDIQNPRVDVLTRVFENRCAWLLWSTWIPENGLDVGIQL